MADGTSAPRPVSMIPLPRIALVGRPNVGKSTLFNRLAGRRQAIVEDVPGVTRDRNYADLEWDGRALSVVDTGGFEPGSRDVLVGQVRQQAQLAVDEAQAIVLVVDGRDASGTAWTGIGNRAAEKGRLLGSGVRRSAARAGRGARIWG